MMASATNLEILRARIFPVIFDILNPSLIIPSKTIGIYRITSPSGKIYIGQSRDIIRRMESYRNIKCKGQTLIYHSILKYGLDKHLFELVCVCEIFELNDFECYYMNLHDSFNTKTGLNLKIGGDVKVKVSDETRKKQSNSHIGQTPWNKGKKVTPEVLAKMKLVNKGKKRTEEDKIKMRVPKPPRTAEHNKNNADARRGQKFSEQSLINMNEWRKDEVKVKEVGRKISESNKGRKLSEEHKEKISKTTKGRKGKPLTEEAKEKIRQFNIGKKASQESKDKMRASKKGTKPSEEAIRRSIEANTGRKASDETKKKQSLAKLGKKISPETASKREASRKRNKELIEEERRMMVF